MQEVSQTSSQNIFLWQKGEIEGPYDPNDIRELLLRQELPPTTLALFGEEGKWTPISILLKNVEAETPKPLSSNTKRSKSLKLIFCFSLLAAFALGLFTKHHLYQTTSRSVIDDPQANARNMVLQEDSLGHENSQRQITNQEVEDLKSKLSDETNAKKENQERVQRLQSDLQDASDRLARETKRGKILEDLSKDLAIDHQKLRESVIPAIGIDRDLFLRVNIDPGLLQIDPMAVRLAISRPLTTAGFKLVFEPPTDRQYLLINYSFAQASNTQYGFSAYSANVRCVGLAWQSGNVRPTILFSEFATGYAGRNSGYAKQILTDAEMFGEMLVDVLGKIDRDALAVNYDMFDLSVELAEAAEKLRSLASSAEKPAAATGTGFFVSPKGLIVTNHHVVEDHEKVEVWIPSTGKTLPAKVIANDRTNDLAFLRLDVATDLPEDLKYPIIAKSPPEVGQNVFTVGFPVPEIMGREPKYSAGVLNAHSGARGNMRFLQHSIPIQPGNSGGLLVSETGEICGIVQSTLNAMMLLGESGALPQNVSYAIKSELLWDFAAANSLSEQLSEGERSPIESKDAIRLSVLITTRVK